MTTYLDYDPNEVRASLLVGRLEERAWLDDKLTSYLERNDNRARSLCLLGEKGIGKSLIARGVLAQLRGRHSASTLFLEVDCRRWRSWREVLAAAARATVEELTSLKAAMAPVSEELIDTAKVLSTLTAFNDVQLKTVHEHLRQLSAAAALRGPQELLSLLRIHFGISLERTEKSVRSLTGQVRFDDHRIGAGLVALFRDIREQGLQVVLFLDNIDELRHEYRSEEVRSRVERDVKGILTLRDAPIRLVLTMRSYYSGILPRDIFDRWVLDRPSPDDLVAILTRRVDEESDEARERFTRDDVQAVAGQLAEIASTPLAFLVWFKFLFERGVPIGSVPDGLLDFLRTYYATLRTDVIERVAAAFDDPNQPAPRARILEACDGNEAVFAQLEDRQAVLPWDFWNPTSYTLDPELHFLHPSRRID